MPRTKAPKIVKKEQDQFERQKKELLQHLEIEEMMDLQRLDTIYQEAILNLEIFFIEEPLKITNSMTNKTQAELTKLNSLLVNNNTLLAANITRKALTRSSNTVGDDEGYLTAGSRSVSSDRKSRSQTQGNRECPSRSLSRSKTMKKVRPNKTPANKNPLGIQVITPKVKMNKPQIFLRRPKQGERAVSLQGSPLMVSNVVTDTECSVTIPFGNGDVWAIQPQKGPLRMSQLPDLNHNTQQQLATLRDNINRICAMQATRK